MTWSHEQEAEQVGALLAHHHIRPQARYLVNFVDGECYVCVVETAYDADNSGDLGIEVDDPRYDEFHQVVLRIVDTVVSGFRRYNEYVSLDYRDFPALIKDADTGDVIYSTEVTAADAGRAQGDASLGE